MHNAQCTIHKKRSVKLEVRSPRSEVRSPKSEVRSQKSEVRSQKSDRCRISDTGSKRPNYQLLIMHYEL